MRFHSSLIYICFSLKKFIFFSSPACIAPYPICQYHCLNIFFSLSNHPIPFIYIHFYRQFKENVPLFTLCLLWLGKGQWVPLSDRLWRFREVDLWTVHLFRPEPRLRHWNCKHPNNIYSTWAFSRAILLKIIYIFFIPPPPHASLFSFFTARGRILDLSFNMWTTRSTESKTPSDS